MFPSRAFPDRYYAPRYWPKVGAAVTISPPGGRVPAAAVYCPGAAALRVAAPGGAVGHVYTPGAAALEVEG